ncbi:hypothetical protein WN51_13998 [Melipona quadrifasciata]|uniref:Uncharacterized protein n=1 Tax=Melipona quadrifasciata TaxID=166423 RepID=A0A0M8ZYW0_9HYME|nr:hypothetical protein WN51_13998 [Melipona quadrifasciata]
MRQIIHILLKTHTISQCAFVFNIQRNCKNGRLDKGIIARKKALRLGRTARSILAVIERLQVPITDGRFRNLPASLPPATKEQNSHEGIADSSETSDYELSLNLWNWLKIKELRNKQFLLVEKNLRIVNGEEEEEEEEEGKDEEKEARRASISQCSEKKKDSRRKIHVFLSMKLLICGFLIVQSVVKFHELLQRSPLVPHCPQISEQKLLYQLALPKPPDTGFSIFSKFRQENRAAMSTILPVMVKVTPKRTHYFSLSESCRRRANKSTSTPSYCEIIFKNVQCYVTKIESAISLRKYIHRNLSSRCSESNIKFEESNQNGINRELIHNGLEIVVEKKRETIFHTMVRRKMQNPIRGKLERFEDDGQEQMKRTAAWINYINDSRDYPRTIEIMRQTLVIVSVGDTQPRLQYKHSHDVDPGYSIGRAMRQSSKASHGPDHRQHPLSDPLRGKDITRVTPKLYGLSCNQIPASCNQIPGEHYTDCDSVLLGTVIIIEARPTAHSPSRRKPAPCTDTFIQDMSVGQAIAYKRAEPPCLLVSTNRVKATMNRLFDKRRAEKKKRRTERRMERGRGERTEKRKKKKDDEDAKYFGVFGCILILWDEFSINI